MSNDADPLTPLYRSQGQPAAATASWPIGRQPSCQFRRQLGYATRAFFCCLSRAAATRCARKETLGSLLIIYKSKISYLITPDL